MRPQNLANNTLFARFFISAFVWKYVVVKAGIGYSHLLSSNDRELGWGESLPPSLFSYKR